MRNYAYQIYENGIYIIFNKLKRIEAFERIYIIYILRFWGDCVSTMILSELRLLAVLKSYAYSWECFHTGGCITMISKHYMLNSTLWN